MPEWGKSEQQGVVSVEADGHDVCTVTFSDSSERDAAQKAVTTTTTTQESDAEATSPTRRLNMYMADAEKDGYESDVSDSDRMVIDEGRDVTDDVMSRSVNKPEGASGVASATVTRSETLSADVAAVISDKIAVSSGVNKTPARKVNRRKASVPIKRDDVESEDEGFESQKSRPSSQGDSDNLDEQLENLTPVSKADSDKGNSTTEAKRESTNTETDSSKQATCCKTQEQSDKTDSAKKRKGGAGGTMRTPEGAGRFKSKLCGGGGVSGAEKVSPTNDLLSRPPEVPESPSQKLSGGERSLVNTLVAKALKLWYDDDAPGGALTDSPRRGYLTVSPRGKGAFELLHSPTSPRYMTKHSKETVSKALLFTADSEFSSGATEGKGAGCSSPAGGGPSAPAGSSTTPTAMTTARLRAMLKERADVTASPNITMPIDERESASLMQFASQVPGWIPLESLTSPDISNFTMINKPFAQMNGEGGGGGRGRSPQHAFSRKSYSCQLCHKAFVHSSNLTRHLRTAHGQGVARARGTAASGGAGLGEAAARDGSGGGGGSTPRTPDILPAALRDARAMVERAATEAETPSRRRHSASDAEAAQILSSMPELVVRGMESHMLAQQRNEAAATPQDIQGTSVTADGSGSEQATASQLSAAAGGGGVGMPRVGTPGEAPAPPPPPPQQQQPGPGHPNALPLSNSPRKENKFGEATGQGPSEGAGVSERNPLAPSDAGHNRLFKCVECGKRFPSHARLARHLYVCHRALIEGLSEGKGHVALGTRTIPISQTTSQPMSPVKMAQNGNHLCRLCGRTFTFSSNLRRHIRKMHLQSPSKVNVAFQAPPLAVNLQSATAPGLQAPDKQLAGGSVICDLCGQTYLTPSDLDAHLKDMHQVIRKKLLFGSRGGGAGAAGDPAGQPRGDNGAPARQDAERGSPLAVQQQNEQSAPAPPPRLDAKPLSAPRSSEAMMREQLAAKGLTSFAVQGPLGSTPPVTSGPAPVAATAPAHTIQSLLGGGVHLPPAPPRPASGTPSPAARPILIVPSLEEKPLQIDLSRRSVTPQSLEHARTPGKVPTSPMDLSVVKKEPASAVVKTETSPGSQPVDLSTGPKHSTAAADSSAVDLSVSSNSNSQSEASKTYNGDGQETADKLEASRSLLRAALQAKHDAKSQHPKLLQLLGDGGTSPAAAAAAAAVAAKNKSLEALVSQAGELRPPFSPLLMAAAQAQMNLAAFPPGAAFPAGLPQFPGAASALFGSPFFPLKRKLSEDGLGPLSPLSAGHDDEKPHKPAKRRKSVSHSYDSDGSKSPSQHSDSGGAQAASQGGGGGVVYDANFPSRVEGKRYICGLCSASFTFQTNLTRHQRKLHGKPFVRKPVLGSGGLMTTLPATPTSLEPLPPAGDSPQPPPPIKYEVPPTPPVFGPGPMMAVQSTD